MADNFFLLGPALQTQRQTIEQTPVPTSEYLSAVRESTFMDTYTKTFVDDLSTKESRMLSKEEIAPILKSNGITMNVPDEGIQEEKFKIMLNRQARKRYLQSVMDRKPNTYLSSAGGLGTGLLVEVLDPTNMVVNLASTAFPPIGAARYANMMARSGSVLGRTALRFGSGAVEAGALTAALEPAYNVARNNLGDDYDVYDSFSTVAFGAALGGGFVGTAGLLGEAFGKGFSKIAKLIPAEDRSDILQAGANMLARDGSVDVHGLLNSSTLTRTGKTVEELLRDAGFMKRIESEGFVPSLREKAEVDFYNNNPDIKEKLTSLEKQISENQPSVKEKYVSALNDYNEVTKIEVKSPSDELLVSRKLSNLEKKYGKGFKEEAVDFETYSAKRKEFETLTDKRKKRTIDNNFLKPLDEKYKGRLSEAYARQDRQIASVDEQRLKAKQDLENLKREVDPSINDLHFKQNADRFNEYMKEKIKFSTQYNKGPMNRVIKSVDEGDAELKVLSDDTPEKLAKEIDDMKSYISDFEERTGIKTDAIDDSMFDVENIKTSLMNYLECRRR